jgi:hypothetical protein
MSIFARRKEYAMRQWTETAYAVHAEGTAMWTGSSGTKYQFQIYRPSNVPPLYDVVYMFVNRDRDGVVQPLYVGVTVDLQDRMAAHEKIYEALDMRMNELHVLEVPHDDNERDATAMDLCATYTMPLNSQA